MAKSQGMKQTWAGDECQGRRANTGRDAALQKVVPNICHLQRWKHVPTAAVLQPAHAPSTIIHLNEILDTVHHIAELRTVMDLLPSCISHS